MTTDRATPDGFSCTRCGQCCRQLSGLQRAVLLTPTDIVRIEQYIERNPSLSGVTFVDDRPIPNAPPELRRIRPREDGDCPFLMADMLCAVHEAKPHQCRHTPYGFFWPEIGWTYPCGEGTSVPSEWTSKAADEIFLDQLTVGGR